MPDKKITELDPLLAAAAADTDVLPVVDVSDTTMAGSGTTKKMTYAEMAKAMGGEARLTLGIPSGAVAAPAAGVKLFGRKRGGRTLPAYVGPFGLDSSLQPYLGGNAVKLYSAVGNTAGASAIDYTATANGTAAATAAWANTNIRTQTRRVNFSSAATVGAAGGMREAQARYWIGNSAGLGGFACTMRFSFGTIPATRRWFVGFAALTTLLPNADPSTWGGTVPGIIGIGQDVGDTNVFFMHNDALGGLATKVDSGMGTVDVNSLYEARIFVAPSVSRAYMSFEKMNGGAIAEYDSGVLTTLPPNNVGLAHHMWCNNATTAAIMSLEISTVYLETDF